MSDDGVEVKAYSHEKMEFRHILLFMCRNLVIFSEMIDEDLTKQFFFVFIRTSVDGVGAEE